MTPSSTLFRFSCISLPKCIDKAKCSCSGFGLKRLLIIYWAQATELQFSSSREDSR